MNTQTLKRIPKPQKHYNEKCDIKKMNLFIFIHSLIPSILYHFAFWMPKLKGQFCLDDSLSMKYTMKWINEMVIYFTICLFVVIWMSMFSLITHLIRLTLYCWPIFVPEHNRISESIIMDSWLLRWTLRWTLSNLLTCIFNWLLGTFTWERHEKVIIKRRSWKSQDEQR